jgi:hypothetical protein
MPRFLRYSEHQSRTLFTTTRRSESRFFAARGVWVGWGVSEAMEGFVTTLAVECQSLSVLEWSQLSAQTTVVPSCFLCSVHTNSFGQILQLGANEADNRVVDNLCGACVHASANPTLDLSTALNGYSMKARVNFAKRHLIPLAQSLVVEEKSDSIFPVDGRDQCGKYVVKCF